MADATIKAMAVGDFVIVVNQTNPQGYILQVQSVTAASGNIPGAATLVVPAGVNAPNPAFPRNLIDGGDFTTNPWQRGTSFTGINNATSPVVYTADRWFAYSNNASASISVSQVTGITAVAGFSQALQIGRASGNAITTPFSLGQVIETADSIRAQGQQVTLSFWAVAGANWSPASGALNVLIATGTGTNQSAGSLLAGTWTNYSSLVVTPQQGASGAATNVAQPITTTWTRYAFNATIPSNTSQIGILISATPVGTAGSADYVQLMGVQLELGPQATPFEHRDVEMELAICQRYFFNIPEPASGVVVGAGMIAAANAEIIFIPLPVQMYKAPAVTVSAGSFKFNIAGTATAVAGFAPGSTHTANYISVVGTTTGTSGQGTLLQGGGGAGYVQASADF